MLEPADTVGGPMGSSRQHRTGTAVIVVALAAAASLALGGQALGAGADVGHVHALAFDGGDRGLLLGTHDGLYRLGTEDTAPRKVGSVSYDLMGLAVLGPRSYVASGHPDAEAARRDRLPANLGLIRTDDGGRRWRSVSLRGAADFHVLRARGSRVLAFDVTQGRLLASTDAGRTWKPRTLPPEVADLALGHEPGAVVASTAKGVVVSGDGGLSYQARARDVGAGLVAWPSRRTLLLVDAGGAVLVSSDGGRTFERRSTLGGRPAALAALGSRVAVLLETGRVVLSLDGGRRFADVS